MEIFIIGDEKGNFLLQLLNKAGYSVTCCSWRHIEQVMVRIRQTDFVIIVPPVTLANDPETFEGIHNECAKIMAQADLGCIINPSGILSGVVTPTQAIRIPSIANKTVTNHLWLKGDLPLLTIPRKTKKDLPLTINDYHIIEQIAKAMFYYWNGLMVKPKQQTLF